jgi:hypothetical protein
VRKRPGPSRLRLPFSYTHRPLSRLRPPCKLSRRQVARNPARSVWGIRQTCAPSYGHPCRTATAATAAGSRTGPVAGPGGSLGRPEVPWGGVVWLVGSWALAGRHGTCPPGGSVQLRLGGPTRLGGGRPVRRRPVRRQRPQKLLLGGGARPQARKARSGPPNL